MKDKELKILLAGIVAMVAATVSLFLFGDDEKKEDFRFSRLEPITETTSADVSKPAKMIISSGTVISTTEPETIPYDEILLDLNTASAEELCLLDGIGETRARAIVQYRETNGDFHNIEEIMNVSGIGEGTFMQIKEHICVVGAEYTEPVTEKAAVQVTTEASSEPETTENTVTEPWTEHEPTLEELVPIDLNTATREELMLLPGIDGEAADGIIRLRESIHGFGSVEELLYVDELTQKQVAELAEFVTVGQ